MEFVRTAADSAFQGKPLWRPSLRLPETLPENLQTAPGVDRYDTTVDRHETFNMQKVSPMFGLMLVFALRCAQGQDLLAMKACTRLGDDAARLSCYDAAMGVSKSPSGAGKPQPAPPAETGSTQPQAKFGDDGRLHSVAKTSLPKNLSAQVREVRLLPAGLYRLTLDNGQVWDTTQADSALAFKANEAVTISRGLLGSYKISLAGHNTSVSAVRKQ